MFASFKITAVSRVSPDTVKIRIRLDAKEWAKAKKIGNLGILYGTDVSNAAYRQLGVMASNPTVDDSERSEGGCKWVTLFYTDTVWTPAPDNVIRVDFYTRKRVA